MTVFDTTENDGGIRLSVLNTVIEPGPQLLIVNQLYRLTNVGQAAYIGGVAFSLPDAAEDVAASVVQGGQFAPLELDDQQRDLSPILPGDVGHTVYLRYAVPYDGEMTLTHALPYRPSSANLVLPQELSLSGDDWQLRQQDEIDGQAYNNYVGQPAEQLTATISGEVAVAVDPNTGEQILVRDEQSELMIGLAALVLTAAVGLLVVIRWQKAPSADPQPLLKEIAVLDDQFAAGEVKRRVYEQKRRDLLQQVRDIWV